VVAYVAVRGGEQATLASVELIREGLASSGGALDVAAIRDALPDLVDQVMGESSLYDPTLAALALKQGGGSPEEAVFLLRAFRSTLERPYFSCVIDTASMRTRRRISAAFKDIPGGQVLGASRDYSHRLLDFSLGEEGEDLEWHEGLEEQDSERRLEEQNSEHRLEEQNSEHLSGGNGLLLPLAGGFDDLASVSAYLKARGLLPALMPDDRPPHDATMEPLSFPAPRSIRLQTLARGMTQAVMAFGYAAIRGFGDAHPTVGELRQGSVAICIAHPLEQGDDTESYYVGSLTVTEVESLFELEEPSGQGLSFGLGYGLVYGCAESKAIAMSVLDHCLSLGDARIPVQDEEFVLYHVDGVEATGFISHLKLPHYVTFQSKLDSARRSRANARLVLGAQVEAEAGAEAEMEAEAERPEAAAEGPQAALTQSYERGPDTPHGSHTTQDPDTTHGSHTTCHEDGETRASSL
jgi:alpha-D-ribose 1-methylphosphonate 5-triphosphate synthase subunit PhnI